MANPLGKFITSGGGRRLVVSDIHGCLATFKQLKRELTLSPDDQLFLLGDYVNKGPSSRAVVDYVIELSAESQVYPLLGNHDLIVLEYLEKGDSDSRQQLVDFGNEDFLDLSEEDKKKYKDFFSGLHRYYILDNFLLVHAGFDFTLANPFRGSSAMIETRDFYYDSSKAQGKTIVHGHLPYPLDHIKTQVSEKKKIIPLDNGCVYPDKEEQGNLLCLELDSAKLWIQKNIE